MSMIESLPTRAFDPQALEFKRTRWSIARTDNTKRVAGLWAERPGLVQIFEDPKLGHGKLVMLRKDVLEDLLACFNDLVAGRAGIEIHVTQATKAILSLKNLLPKVPKEDLTELVEIAATSLGQLDARVVPAGQSTPLQPTPASDETLDYYRGHRIEQEDDED